MSETARHTDPDVTALEIADGSTALEIADEVVALRKENRELRAALEVVRPHLTKYPVLLLTIDKALAKGGE